MTENEKLRALLAEARREIATWHLGPRDPLVQRIDAALAEPVDDYDVDADLRLHKEERLRLRVENLRLERERDEARAEVERLRSVKPIGTYSLDWNHEQERLNTANAAYRRGAAAMREMAITEAVERARYWAEASAAEGGVTTMEDRAEEARSIADEIRFLPLPEDGP